MKKMVFFIMLLTCTIMVQAAVKHVQYKGLSYAVDTELQVAQLSHQTVIIKGDLPIPEVIKYKDKASGKYIECPVVSIAKYALEGQKKLKSLYIPASVQEIGDYAFANCRRLRHIHFASSIGANAGSQNWTSGTKANIHFVLMPGESVSIH